MLVYKLAYIFALFLIYVRYHAYRKKKLKLQFIILKNNISIANENSDRKWIPYF